MTPQTWPERVATCGDRGHIGATYNPQMDRTWCLCGAITRPGDHATHDDCCAHLRGEVVAS